MKFAKINPQNAFLALIILQLFIFGVLNYLFIPTNAIRWIIDTALYLSLAIMLIARYRIKGDAIAFLYVLLLLANVFSFFINANDIVSFIKQVRFTLIGGAIYCLLYYSNFPRDFYVKAIKIIYIIGYCQLPLVIIQQLSYGFLSKFVLLPDFVDFASGTIGYGESGVLGCFLVFLAIAKIQYIIEYGASFKTNIQLLILLAPIGLINSDAQYLFVPLIIAFAFLFNAKINAKFVTFLIIAILLLFSVNAILSITWKGKKTISGYTTGFITKDLANPDLGLDQENRLLRYGSMYYVWASEKNNPSLFGKGPGYWLTRDSEGKEKSITSIWYHCNLILLTYGELGIIGLILIIAIPAAAIFQTNNTFLGKTVRLQSIYLLMIYFYVLPINNLSLCLEIMCFLAFYRKYFFKKYDIKTSTMTSFNTASAFSAW